MIISILFSLPKVFWLKIIKKASVNWAQFWKKNSKILVLKGGHLIIRKGVIINYNSTISVIGDGCLSIGKGCFFNTNCSITCMKSISIGESCMFGNNCVIVDHDHKFKSSEKGFICEEVNIGTNVWIGANCVILKGVSIGNGAVVAAGSIVKCDIPENTMFYQKRSNEYKLIV